MNRHTSETIEPGYRCYTDRSLSDHPISERYFCDHVTRETTRQFVVEKIKRYLKKSCVIDHDSYFFIADVIQLSITIIYVHHVTYELRYVITVSKESELLSSTFHLRRFLRNLLIDNYISIPFIKFLYDTSSNKQTNKYNWEMYLSKKNIIKIFSFKDKFCHGNVWICRAQ